MPRKIPNVPGLALTILRTAYGWHAKDLAARVGVRRTTISSYETGDNQPTRERLEELARVMGAGPQELDLALFAASVALPASVQRRTPVDPTPEERLTIKLAAVTAGRQTMDQVQADLLREAREIKARFALEEGKALANRLKPFSAGARRILVEAAPDYHHWGLALALCLASEKAAADKPAEALKRAELAVLVSRHVPGSEAWRNRLEGYCTGFVANALRVGNDLPGSDATFSHAWRLWRAGEDEAGLLSEAYLLDLEASLRRDQRNFTEALNLHDQALAKARPEEVGSILLNKSATLEQRGDSEASIEVLDQAAQVVDSKRQPRMLWVLRFNQTANLCRLGRAEEAARIVPKVRNLAEHLRNDLDLVRTYWLEGKVAAGLGRHEAAQAVLEQVRRDFELRNLPFDYALASLDLALLYREEGRKALAAEILEIFRAQGVHREAFAALLLFQNAAEKQEVTAELVQRLQAYLLEARKNPKLRFMV